MRFSQLFVVVGFVSFFGSCDGGLFEWEKFTDAEAGSFPGKFPSFLEASHLLSEASQVYGGMMRELTVGVSVEGRLQNAYWISSDFLNKKKQSEPLTSVKCSFFDDILKEEKGDVEQGSKKAAALEGLKDDRDSICGIGLTSDRKWRPKPTMLVTSLHHAREPVSLTVGLFAVIQMLEQMDLWRDSKFKTNLTTNSGLITADQVAFALFSRDFLFLPFVNPDGYEAILNSSNVDLRKNRRPTCSQVQTRTLVPHWNLLNRWRRQPPAPQTRPLALSDQEQTQRQKLDGVDLNRNYDDHFQTAHSPCDAEEYEGTRAFSEPETRTIRRIAKIFESSIGTALNFHAFGDVWTHPFNCCANKKLDADTAKIFAEIQSVLNISMFGSAPQIPALGYQTTGEADDWFLQTHDVISMSPEVGPEESGFFPDAEIVRKTNRDTFGRIWSVFSKTGIELTLHGLSGAGPLSACFPQEDAHARIAGAATASRYLRRPKTENDDRGPVLVIANTGVTRQPRSLGMIEITLTEGSSLPTRQNDLQFFDQFAGPRVMSEEEVKVSDRDHPRRNVSGEIAVVEVDVKGTEGPPRESYQMVGGYSRSVDWIPAGRSSLIVELPPLGNGTTTAHVCVTWVSSKTEVVAIDGSPSANGRIGFCQCGRVEVSGGRLAGQQEETETETSCEKSTAVMLTEKSSRSCPYCKEMTALISEKADGDGNGGSEFPAAVAAAAGIGGFALMTTFFMLRRNYSRKSGPVGRYLADIVRRRGISLFSPS